MYEDGVKQSTSHTHSLANGKKKAPQSSCYHRTPRQASEGAGKPALWKLCAAVPETGEDRCLAWQAGLTLHKGKISTHSKLSWFHMDHTPVGCPQNRQTPLLMHDDRSVGLAQAFRGIWQVRRLTRASHYIT